jgi:hypothetical protein
MQSMPLLMKTLSPTQSTGFLLELLMPLKTKDNVALAGLSQQQVHLNPPGRSSQVLFTTSLNNNSLIALLLIWVVMVGGNTKHTTTTRQASQ